MSRRQLRDLGISDGAIEKAVAAGHLHPAYRGTFGVGHPPIGTHGQMLAAVLACGPGAVVSHLTAAHLLGITDRMPTSIEIVAPGESGRGIKGIRRRHVCQPRGPEAGHCKAIPCTSPSRTIVDLAGMLSEHSLRRIVERAAVTNMLDIPATERILAAGRRRGGPLVRRVLHDWTHYRPAGTSQGDERQTDLNSALEARLLALIGAAGLPAPLCNHPIVASTERLVVDFLWPEQRLVVETDGRRFHDNPVAFERDRHRDRALQLSGYRVVRFTYRQTMEEPDEAIAAIRRLLVGDIG